MSVVGTNRPTSALQHSVCYLGHCCCSGGAPLTLGFSGIA